MKKKEIKESFKTVWKMFDQRADAEHYIEKAAEYKAQIDAAHKILDRLGVEKTGKTTGILGSFPRDLLLNERLLTLLEKKDEKA